MGARRPSQSTMWCCTTVRQGLQGALPTTGSGTCGCANTDSRWMTALTLIQANWTCLPRAPMQTQSLQTGIFRLQTLRRCGPGVRLDRLDFRTAGFLPRQCVLMVRLGPHRTVADAETDTEPEMPMFMEEYAPRAALYESLPGFLLRMADRGRLNHRPVSPVWMVFSGGSG